jgi:hypothetical protein
MAVHIRAGVGDLRLTLSNADEVLDSQVAATPQEANRVAIMMIASRDAFDPGDTLTCRHANEGREANLAFALVGGRPEASLIRWRKLNALDWTTLHASAVCPSRHRFHIWDERVLTISRVNAGLCGNEYRCNRSRSV